MLKFGNGSGGGSDERRNQERDREPGIRLLPEGNFQKFPAGLFDSGNGGDSHPFGKEPGALWRRRNQADCGTGDSVSETGCCVGSTVAGNPAKSAGKSARSAAGRI